MLGLPGLLPLATMRSKAKVVVVDLPCQTLAQVTWVALAAPLCLQHARQEQVLVMLAASAALLQTGQASQERALVVSVVLSQVMWVASVMLQSTGQASQERALAPCMESSPAQGLANQASGRGRPVLMVQGMPTLTSPARQRLL